MELTIFNKENALQEPIGQNAKPSISISKGGVIRLNKKLVDFLEIEIGDGIEIAKDKTDAGNWFFRVSDDGIPCRHHNKKNPDGSLVFQSTIIYNEILKALELDSRAKFLVGIEKDEEGWFPIFTSTAK